MAIAVQLDFYEGTLEQYDQVIEKMGFQPGGPGGPGGLFHWVTKTDSGIRVVDVWESREAFERFTAERLIPALAAVGGPPPARQEVYATYHAGIVLRSQPDA